MALWIHKTAKRRGRMLEDSAFGRGECRTEGPVPRAAPRFANVRSSFGLPHLAMSLRCHRRDAWNRLDMALIYADGVLLRELRTGGNDPQIHPLIVSAAHAR